jgi:hypothetical protein
MAAAWLVQHGKRVPPGVAPFLVIGWLNRLCLWCLSYSESGSLSGLSLGRVGTLAWPEAIEDGMSAAKAGEAILGSLRAGGFIEGEPPAIHDFADHHARILKERVRKRDDHDQMDGTGRYQNAERSAPHSAEGSAPQSAERSADSPAEGSAHTGTGTGTGTGSTPLPPRPGGSSASLPAAPKSARKRDVEAHLAAGGSLRLCPECGKPAEAGGILCPYHAAAARGGA